MKTQELYGRLVRCIYGNDNDPDTRAKFKNVGIYINDVADEVNELLLGIAKKYSDD